MQGEPIPPTYEEIERDMEYARNAVRREERKKLLRLRWGFARLNYLFFKKYYPNSRDVQYWKKVMTKFREHLNWLEKLK